MPSGYANSTGTWVFREHVKARGLWGVVRESKMALEVTIHETPDHPSGRGRDKARATAEIQS